MTQRIKEKLGQEFKEALADRQGYEKESRTDMAVELNTNAPVTSSAYLQKVYEGDNKGWEDKYFYPAPEMRSNVLTSWLEEKNDVRDIDRVWINLERMDKRVPDEDPFHFFPINRGENVVINTEQTAMVAREAAIHWPKCKKCEHRLYWCPIVPKEDENGKRDPRDLYVNYRDRMIFCDNPACVMCNKDIGLRASNIQFPEKKITSMFRRPFLHDIARRKREYARNIIRTPKILVRYLVLKGISIRRPPSVYSNDTAREKEFKDVPYSDLRGQDDPHLYVDASPDD